MVIIVIAIFFVVKYWKKEKSEKVESSNDKLGNYIKKSLKRGDTKEKIKTNLINAGWPEYTVDNALRNY